jgi:hypothetical protein
LYNQLYFFKTAGEVFARSTGEGMRCFCGVHRSATITYLVELTTNPLSIISTPMHLLGMEGLQVAQLQRLTPVVAV